MKLFQNEIGLVGRTCEFGETTSAQWLIPDCLNVFTWKDCPDIVIRNWDEVHEVRSLSEIGFTEICKETFMRTNELQLHRKDHDSTIGFLASEHAMFTTARCDNDFVRDVHSAVSNWPDYVPPNQMGRTLWETINRISQQVAMQEDEKRFLSASFA